MKLVPNCIITIVILVGIVVLAEAQLQQHDREAAFRRRLNLGNKRKPSTTTTTESPEYDYYEADIEEQPVPQPPPRPQSNSKNKDKFKQSKPKPMPMPLPLPKEEPEEEMDDNIMSSCPGQHDGWFADASQCDKYYECVHGEMREKLCPDGLVFDASRWDIEKCELSHIVDCSDRPLLQPAQPTPFCPRQNGYYAHNDTRICDKYFHCANGIPHPIICPDGLVFSNKTATCAFRDKDKHAHCVFGATEKNLEPNKDNEDDDGEFRCPKILIRDGSQVPHPLYPDPKDCQYYYICIDGITPRRNGCELGQVYSEATSSCSSPKEVPECKDWYADIFDYDENGDIAVSTTTTTTTTPKPKPKPRPRPGGTSGPKRRGKPPTTTTEAPTK